MLALAARAWADSIAWRSVGDRSSPGDGAGTDRRRRAGAGVSAAASARERFLDRAEDRFEAIDGVAALALAEPLHRVVDHDVLGQPGGTLGGGHLEDAVQVEVEPDQDLVAGGDLGQSFDQELADQVLYRVSSFSPWKTRISAASCSSTTVE